MRRCRFRRVLAQDGAHHIRGRFARERPAAGRHFVQHAPEAEDVRPRVDRLAAHLLGRHVTDRPEDHARAARWRWSTVCVAAGSRRVLLGESEVQHLDAAVAGDQHDVLGLEVAVDDAERVGGRDAFRCLRGDVEQLADGDGAALDHRSAAISPSTSSETMYAWPSVCPTSYTATMFGWLRAPRRARLLLEALAADRVAGDVGGQDLHRDGAVQAGVFARATPAPMPPSPSLSRMS